MLLTYSDVCPYQKADPTTLGREYDTAHIKGQILEARARFEQAMYTKVVSCFADTWVRPLPYLANDIKFW